ncbi:MAG: gluconolactonase [Gammaproteobacteria bacterium]|jgi:sugar lactone lactonase YvrE|nr:gluconolactonase [Gammaproteobacteria bacterium]
MNIQCIYKTPCILGECPVWHPVEKVLYWIDILKPALHRLDLATQEHQTWPMPTNICCITPHADGGLMAAMRTYLARIEIPSGKVIKLDQTVPEDGPYMFNDGKNDRQGRFWAGTKDVKEKSPIGTLYRMDQNGNVTPMANHIVETNGIAWSPDNRTLYYCDTLPRHIWQCDFDPVTGNISNQRIFVQVPEGEGLPDGLTVDAAGYIWSSHWDGGRVVRYTPSGEIERVIHFPAPLTSSCCFGGEDYKTLFVTTISHGLTQEEELNYPLSGCVFAVYIDDVQGLPEPCYSY